MPEKLDRCVADVKAKGGVDNPWAVCQASIGKETDNLDDKIKEQLVNSKIITDHKKEIKENVNANRQVPYFNPKIKTGKVEPEIGKTTKGIGGDKLNQDSFLWKSIFDAQLNQNVKDTKK